MNRFYLNGEQAQVGVVAGMWTQEDLDKAKKSEDGNIKYNWYLQGYGVVQKK